MAGPVGGPIRGFVLWRPGSSADQVGPCIAEPDAGRALLDDAGRRLAGRPAIVDIPTGPRRGHRVGRGPRPEAEPGVLADDPRGGRRGGPGPTLGEFGARDGLSEVRRGKDEGDRMVHDAVRDIDDLEDRLSTPTEGALETMARLEGDLIVLGVAGKMGPTLARMARRASDTVGARRRVIGVARFTDAASEGKLRSHGVETIRCDLLDEDGLARLPDAPNVVYMAGRKFGTTGQEAATWAMNAYLPGPVCRRYRASRIVAFSTGNVYGPVPVAGGSRESDAPDPRGEYAMSCLGRERIFEHFSRTLVIPMALIRLNYATEMRYGVLVDLAGRVRDGLPDRPVGRVVQRHLAGGRERDGPAGVRPRRDAAAGRST